jgi:hypothetical protein
MEFSFFKNTNKKKEKNIYIIASYTFYFYFFLCFLKKKNKKGKSWAKVEQKSWTFNIFLCILLPKISPSKKTTVQFLFLK